MFLVVKKSRLIAAVLLVIVLAAAVGLGAGGVVTNAFSGKKKLPVYYVSTEESKVALTFDAAWGADKTSKIMDILDEYGVKATFFLVGFWIDAYPDKVKEINERGFLIGNHSTNHPHFNSLSESRIADEISVTNKKITDITGIEVKYFRAPFGEYDNRLIEYTEKNSMKCIQWDVDTLDWKGLSGGEIASRVMARVKKGSIILCHNNSDHILDALPIILTGLKNKGLTPVRLDELVLDGEYYIDNNGMQIAK